MVALTGELGEPPDRIVDLWQLDALRGIALDGDAVVLGALTTYTDIRRSALCREHLPGLVEAAATIGAAQIQNRGTLGGNIANASPAGDTLPVLLALDADVRARQRPRRARSSPRVDFWPAYRRTALAPDELIAADPGPARAGPRGPLPQGRDASRAVDQQGRDGPRLARRRRRSTAWDSTSASALGSVAATPIRAARDRGGPRGPTADPGDRRPRRRDPGRRAPSDRRRPLDRRVPPARRRARPAPADPRGRAAGERPGRSRRRRPRCRRSTCSTSISPGTFAAADGAAVRGRAAVPRPARDGPPVRHRSSALFDEARRDRPRDARMAEQVELIDAHPRLGAPPGARLGAVVRASRATTDGRRRPTVARRASTASTRAYEARFGFRYCVFVAGRSRAALLPGFEAALDGRPRRRDRAAPSTRSSTSRATGMPD